MSCHPRDTDLALCPDSINSSINKTKIKTQTKDFFNGKTQNLLWTKQRQEKTNINMKLKVIS